MRASFVAVIALSGLFAASCSAIVTISEDEIRCAGEGPADPCPDGRVCREGYCQLAGSDSGVPDTGCIPDERGELCNGIDDDCDDLIDEGQDEDMDGYTWCGGGISSAADCDDNDPTAYPGDSVTLPADEMCDGADNDCDGLIDESPLESPICGSALECIDRECADPNDCSLPSVMCATAEFCDFDMTPPRCQMGGCMPGSCPPAQVCNVESGDCVIPARIGDVCVTDEDCSESAICVDGLALGLTDSVCSLACCTDSDCPSDTICWASGSGAKMCIRPELVGRTMGSTAGSMSCTNDGDCLSGVCADDNTCLEHCGDNADCGSDACTTTVLSDEMFILFACGEAKGGDTQGLPAFSGGCSSGLWMRDTYGCTFADGCANVCIGTCNTSADCTSGVEDLDFYCGFGALAMYSNSIAICREKTHLGAGTTGATCTNHGGCRDATCLSRVCSDTCCSDKDCSGLNRCRPVDIRGQWETHCLP